MTNHFDDPLARARKRSARLSELGMNLNAILKKMELLNDQRITPAAADQIKFEARRAVSQILEIGGTIEIDEPKYRIPKPQKTGQPIEDFVGTPAQNTKNGKFNPFPV